jgi:hypothetical protein
MRQQLADPAVGLQERPAQLAGTRAGIYCRNAPGVNSGGVSMRYTSSPEMLDDLLHAVAGFQKHLVGYRAVATAVNQLSHQVIEYRTLDS